MTRSTDADISQRTNGWAAREMLKFAGAVTVLDKFAKTVRMPKNKSSTVKFRRPKTFTAATTPLQEGVTPATTKFGYEDVEVPLKQYGEVVEITDVIEDTHEDPVLQDATEQSGDNIGRTTEALTYGTLKAGTNVFYQNGASRSAVNTKISISKQRAVVRALKAQKAKKITKILSPSPDYETRAVEAAYVAIAHTDCEADIRALPGFTPVAEYGSRKPLCEEELGSVEDVRYITSADLDPIIDAGGAHGGNVVSTGGTSADVYPVLYMGREAYGTVALKGAGAVAPSIIPVGKKTKDDPLGQRGYVGWKTWFASLILNQNWMARLEVAVSEL